MAGKIFISIVGTNDAGKLVGKNDGAILTALKKYGKKYFDAIFILYTETKGDNNLYVKTAKYLYSQIQNRGYCKAVEIKKLGIRNPIDHNEIYIELLKDCKEIEAKTGSGKKFIASISSGTPAMSACWIMMAESGDFNAELIQVIPPKYGKNPISKVKLGTALPRIKRLEEEVRKLKPEIKMDISKAHLYVNNIPIDLSMTEFVYYRYFLERKLNDEEALRVSEIYMPVEFYTKVMEYFKESYPTEDLYYKGKKEILATNFRSTISKMKSKFKRSVANSLIEYIEISSIGKRGNITYEIRLDKEKIEILK